MFAQRTYIGVAVAAAIATAGVGTALAAGASLPFSDDGNTINGCYSPGGALKLLTPMQSSCPGGYTAIHWNVTGPQGPAGEQGAARTEGRSGPAAEAVGLRGGRPGDDDPRWRDEGSHRIVRVLVGHRRRRRLQHGRGVEVTNSDPDGPQLHAWVVVAFNPTSNDAQGNAVVECSRSQ